ncbi:hypothetical protein AAFF_G00280390 [Aldrovandia affinis]|uniref:Uncharacterized protein n=1 Tax=Aldrovandia affinis TaxID=143900 RepID=A0AAD7RAC6_9TELE|nr:hypothetical protein AAFF_G00280390 [Aldrovandia affinis]
MSGRLPETVSVMRRLTPLSHGISICRSSENTETDDQGRKIYKFNLCPPGARPLMDYRRRGSDPPLTPDTSANMSLRPAVLSQRWSASRGDASTLGPPPFLAARIRSAAGLSELQAAGLASPRWLPIVSALRHRRHSKPDMDGSRAYDPGLQTKGPSLTGRLGPRTRLTHGPTLSQSPVGVEETGQWDLLWDGRLCSIMRRPKPPRTAADLQPITSHFPRARQLSARTIKTSESATTLLPPRGCALRSID